MMNNGSPLTRKQTVRLMIALTILAWATQTLFKQWGYGQDINPDASSQTAAVQTVEKFVPGVSRTGAGSVLEMRADATVIGGDVKLRQLCRWSDRDKPLFDPVGDLIIARLGERMPFKGITVEELRGTLRDAGVNIASINFAGALSCTVSRSDVAYDEKDALQQWVDAKQTTLTAASGDEGPATAPATAGLLSHAGPAVLTLRTALIADLASRLNLPAETLQVDFRPNDEKILNLSRPLFDYSIEPQHAKMLGSVTWNVTLSHEGSNKRLTISAQARAWQEQIVAAKPLATRQLLRADDVTTKRTLVDDLNEDPLLTLNQVVGQQASREIRTGTVMTARLIDPVELVKTGQFVTITLDQGSVQIKTVARAMETGSFGQTIRVKNEETREVFQVLITGPQTATMNLSTPLASIER